jgi:hypothetical protein
VHSDAQDDDQRRDARSAPKNSPRCGPADGDHGRNLRLDPFEDWDRRAAACRGRSCERDEGVGGSVAAVVDRLLGSSSVGCGRCAGIAERPSLTLSRSSTGEVAEFDTRTPHGFSYARDVAASDSADRG